VHLVAFGFGIFMVEAQSQRCAQDRIAETTHPSVIVASKRNFPHGCAHRGLSYDPRTVAARQFLYTCRDLQTYPALRSLNGIHFPHCAPPR
jgi:hypothetical protein